MNKSVFGFAFVLASLAAMSATHGADAARPGQSEPGFRLVILKADPMFEEGKTVQDYERVWERVKKPGSEVLFEVGVREIESYDWKRQSITLTAEATKRLVAVLPSREQMNPTARSIKNMSERLGWGDAVGLSLLYKGFLVFVEGRPVYGGIVLEPMSQLRIHFPVLRFETRNNKSVLSVMPVHVPFMTRDPVLSGQAGDLEPVFQPAAGDWKQFPQPMRDRFLADASSTTTKQFREAIMSPSIRKILDGAGKLAK